MSNDVMILKTDELERIDRGAGVVTTPLVGKWNQKASQLTTGMTAFEPGTGIAMHSHNVEETVMILEGEATVVVGDDTYDVKAGDVTWIPAGVSHYFKNRGSGTMRIYWVYLTQDVTRTLTESGRTIEHLGEEDRKVATRA